MNTLLFSTANRYFSVPEKLHILAELAEGLLTDAQAIDKYQLSSKLLRAWRKWRHLHILKKYNPCTVSKPKKSPAEQLKELERKNRELQKELEYQKLRADALDKLIEVGERELNISIRKKSGSKL
jgi:transposase-like protein